MKTSLRLCFILALALSGSAQAGFGELPAALEGRLNGETLPAESPVGEVPASQSPCMLPPSGRLWNQPTDFTYYKYNQSGSIQRKQGEPVHDSVREIQSRLAHWRNQDLDLDSEILIVADTATKRVWFLDRGGAVQYRESERDGGKAGDHRIISPWFPTNPGKKDKPSPEGLFKADNVDPTHHSSIYNSAPMNNFIGLEDNADGAGFHEGKMGGVGSHGCLRLPEKVARLLANTAKAESAIPKAPKDKNALATLKPFMKNGKSVYRIRPAHALIVNGLKPADIEGIQHWARDTWGVKDFDAAALGMIAKP
jgi:hypothetical protein